MNKKPNPTRRKLTLSELSRVTGGVTVPSTSSDHEHPYNS